LYLVDAENRFFLLSLPAILANDLLVAFEADQRAAEKDIEKM
jgi:hypothetical protein